MIASSIVKSVEITGSGSGGSGTSDVKETDLQKAEKEYKETITELTNQKANGVLKEKRI